MCTICLRLHTKMFFCSLSGNSFLVVHSVYLTKRATRVRNSCRVIFCFSLHIIFSNYYTLHLRVTPKYFSFAIFFIFIQHSKNFIQQLFDLPFHCSLVKKFKCKRNNKVIELNSCKRLSSFFLVFENLRLTINYSNL